MRKIAILTIMLSLVLLLQGGNAMSDYNIQMSQRNSNNTNWDNLYPKTKAENVITANGNVATDLASKASITYVDNKTSSLASGSPKGVYATVSALTTAYPGGNTNIYVVNADKKWYYWNGTAWTAGGDFLGSDTSNTVNGLVNGLATPLSFGSLAKSTGDFTSFRNYSATFKGWANQFSKANFSDTITRIEVYATTTANSTINLVVYNSGMATELYRTTAISGTSGQGKIVFNVNIPLSILTDTFYIAFTTDLSTFGIMPANAQTDAGYTGTIYYYSTSWQPSSTGYNGDMKVFTGYQAVLKPHTHTVSDITDLSIGTNKVKLSLPDKYDLVVGDTFELFYRGIILANNPYNYNIKVLSSKGSAYKRKYVYKPVVGDVGTQTLNISVYNDDDVLLDTKTVNLVVKAKASNPTSTKNILCVGDSLTSGGQWVTELHNRIVTQDGLSNMKFIGTQGTAPNKYEGYGGWTYDYYLSNINTGSVVWAVGSHDKDTTDQKAIYKDSNSVQWSLETIQSGKIKLVRISASGTLPSSGTLTWISGGTHTGNITYTSTIAEMNSPFWNETTNAVDFNNYATEIGVSSIDYCYILLGWNNTGSTESAYKASMRSFIDKLRASFPTTKIGLVGLQVPDPDGLGANYGASWNYKDTLKFVFEMNRWIKEVSAEYTDIEFINLAGQFDSEYNMQSADLSVNTRNATTERRGTNGVHPALEGYYQIADAVYRNLTGRI
jgi:hypothetical protein